MKKLIFGAVMAVVMMGLAACGKKGPDRIIIVDDADSVAEVAEQAPVSEPQPVAEVVQEEVELMPTFAQMKQIIQDSWDERLPQSHKVLRQLNMSCVKYDREVDPEEPGLTYVSAFYGKNVVVSKKKNREGYDEYVLQPTAKHAVCIELSLDTDNYEAIHFSDAADYANFLQTIHADEYEDWSPQGLNNGWYVVTFHMG